MWLTLKVKQTQTYLDIIYKEQVPMTILNYLHLQGIPGIIFCAEDHDGECVAVGVGRICPFPVNVYNAMVLLFSKSG